MTEPVPNRRSATYVSATISLGAIVVACSAWDLVRHPVGAEWLILLILTIASGCATLRAYRKISEKSLISPTC